MITTILIVLVAVVVLIVIIAVLALHFLRADDSDAFDDMPEEPRSAGLPLADPPREQVSASAARRRSRHPEPVREQAPRDPWAAGRPGRPTENRPASQRDRETGPRSDVPDRRSGQPAGTRPVASTARSATSAKAAGPDAQTNSWDSMSDVDYWAELAADKPPVSPAASGAAPARPNGKARRGAAAKPGARTAPAGRSAQRGDATPLPPGPIPAAEPVGSLPVRPRSQPARAGAGASAGRGGEVGQTEQFDARAARAAGYGSEAATQSLAALARLSGPQPPTPRPAAGPRTGGGPRTGPRTGPRPASPPQPTGYSRMPVPLDDDPLTSPSFPAINTSDSRSYRARRSSGAHTGPHAGPPTGAQPVDGRSSGGFARPPAQYPGPQSPAAQMSAPQMPASPPPAPQLPPVANPYGSYVSAPQPGYQGGGTVHQDVPSYGGGYGQQADGSWHGTAASGYLPTAGYPTGSHNGNGHNGNGHNGNGNGHHGYAPVGDQQAAVSGGNGYNGIDYQNLNYQGSDYPPAPVPDGYAPQNQQAGQYDQRGYGAPEPVYGQDGYQGYPGYGTGGRQ